MTPDELQTLVVRISEQVRTPVDYVSLIAYLLTGRPPGRAQRVSVNGPRRRR